MYKKLKEYYYTIEKVLKNDRKVSIILAVFVIKGLYFRLLFHREMQPINWTIKLIVVV